MKGGKIKMMNEFDNMENLYKQALEGIAKCNKVIAENQCNKPKDIGDRVMVWDGSFSEDLETGEHYSGIDDIFQYPVILIEKNCKNPYVDSIDKDITANRDIVVYSPKYKRKIATCMDQVKLIE